MQKIQKFWFLGIIVISLASCATGLAQDVKKDQQKWEYTFYWPDKEEGTPFSSKVMAKLNELGDQGWELISVNAHNGSWVTSACYIFKRPKK